MTRPRLIPPILALALGACAGLQPAPEPAPAPPAAAPPVVAAPAPPLAPAPPPPPDPREPLAAERRTEAAALERQGQLRRALDQWKIALAIDPGSPAARDGLRALQARIDRGVTLQIEQGRAALARGAHGEARRRFLAALALDPTNRAAFEALQNEAREVEFITHTVRPGDSLGALAQYYYGDRSRWEVIWETNNLPLSPRLAAGTTLKIPEIPGVPFVHQAVRPAERPPRPEEPPPAAMAPPAPTPPAPAPPLPREEPVVEVNPLLAEAHEAFERQDYVVALADLDKYLASHPKSPEGLDLQKAALYRQGRVQLERQEYPEAYRTLTRLARLQPNYEDSPGLLREARTQLIARHYTEGFRLFREEKVREAIAQWRLVLELDPEHANAKKNIEQAERVLRALEQRRQR